MWIVSFALRRPLSIAVMALLMMVLGVLSYTRVNDIEHIESEWIAGAGVIKIYFHPGASLAGGIAQMSSTAETLLSIFPPGMQAPNIVNYNAANVPVVQLNISSETLSEQQVFDYGLNFIQIG